MAVQSIDQYKQQAANEYDPQYNAQVNSLKSSLANKLSAFDAQKVSANQSYDGQVNGQNLNNTLTKNNYNNQTLSRGLSRSSIATSGMAGLDDKNTRIIGGINADRTNALRGIDQNVANENVNFNNQFNTMQADRDKQIAALARQLYDSDWSKSMQEKQLAQEAALAREQMAVQRGAYSYSGGGAADEDAATDTYAAEKYAMDRIWNDPSYTNFDDKMKALQAARDGLAANGASLAGLQYGDQKVMAYQDYVKNNQYVAPPKKANPLKVQTNYGTGKYQY